MPTFPVTKCVRLHEAKKGALVSIRYDQDNLVFGFRASLAGEEDDPRLPAFVALQRKPDGSLSATHIRVSANTHVVDHGIAWHLRVSARDWDATLQVRRYSVEESGLLVLDRQSVLGLIVADSENHSYLGLKDWVLEQPIRTEVIAARHWNVSLAGGSKDVDWPLGE